MTGDALDLSVVVPAYDEAENLERLVAEVTAALAPTGVAWELVVADDGSDDDTPAVLARLAAADPRVRSLRMPARSGQTAALAAGLHAARAPLLATLDADLQCSPSELPALLDDLRTSGADMACGIRGARHDPPSRRLASAFSNAIRRALVAPRVRDLACPLRVFRRDALARVEAMTPLFHGAHRWLPALFVVAGLRVVQRPVPHHPRVAGVSKYTTRGRLVPVVRELGRVLALTLARSRTRRIVALALLCALAAVPFFHAVGRWPLTEPDEGRNAEVAREMLSAGSWAVPRFNDLPYLDKPVLLFWLIAAAYRLVGVSELGARLPSAFAGVATVALTFAIARRLLDARRAVLAAGILATMPLVIVYARLTIFDMPLTAIVTAALYCLLRAQLDGRPWTFLPAAGLAMGLGVLMKGPVGVAVPLLVWVAGRGALGPRRRAGAGPVLAAVAIVVVVVGAWLVQVERLEPGFLHYALFDETLLRYTSAERFHRGGPVYYYAEVLGWGTGIWAIVLAAFAPSLWRRWRASAPEAPVIAFCARATLALFVFFSCSASKRPHYLLPAMVPVAILVAIAVAAERVRFAALVRILGRAAVGVGFAVLVAGFAGMKATDGDFRVVTPALLLGAGAFVMAWGIVAAAGARRVPVAIACALVFAPGLGAVLLKPLDGYAESRSSRALAAAIEPGANVVCIEAFRTSLPFYLGRPLLLVSVTGRELTSNYIRARADRLMNDDVLAPMTRLQEVVDPRVPVYLLASPWRLGWRRELGGARRFVQVYADRQNVLLRPEG